MSVICWRSGVPIEGEHPAISEPVIGQVPQSAKLFGAAIGKRLEVGGGRQNVKCQKGRSKSQMTGSEPEARNSRTRTRNLERKDKSFHLRNPYSTLESIRYKKSEFKNRETSVLTRLWTVAEQTGGGLNEDCIPNYDMECAHVSTETRISADPESIRYFRRLPRPLCHVLARNSMLKSSASAVEKQIILPAFPWGLAQLSPGSVHGDGYLNPLAGRLAHQG